MASILPEEGCTSKILLPTTLLPIYFCRARVAKSLKMSQLQIELDLDSKQQLRPPLKWAGGKRWLLPHISHYWASMPNRRLIEPFCGGLAICFGLRPKQALINDLNPHLINFYRWLKHGLKISIPMKNEESQYYKNRNRFNKLVENRNFNTKEAASLFYYLNRTGYNGLCRFNRRGEFNVPFGKYEKINYIRDFSSYSVSFANWEFMNSDFESIPLDKEDFIYADPPYDVEFTQYSKEVFGWEQQVRTAEWLSNHKGPVIISNQATDRVEKLYRRLGYKLLFMAGPRRISCTGDRKPAMEVLALRNIKSD